MKYVGGKLSKQETGVKVALFLTFKIYSFSYDIIIWTSSNHEMLKQDFKSESSLFACFASFLITWSIKFLAELIKIQNLSLINKYTF